MQILEIGTSFGISTSYLALAQPTAHVTTIEGSPAIAAIARDTFTMLGSENIHLVEAKAQEVLGKIAATAEALDLIFIDGHHNQEATLSFFDIIKPRLHHGSIVVVGDIHWSASMESAWQKLAQHEMVTLSVDIFHAGILFFNSDLQKETEILRW